MQTLCINGVDVSQINFFNQKAEFYQAKNELITGFLKSPDKTNERVFSVTCWLQDFVSISFQCGVMERCWQPLLLLWLTAGLVKNIETVKDGETVRKVLAFNTILLQLSISIFFQFSITIVPVPPIS